MDQVQQGHACLCLLPFVPKRGIPARDRLLLEDPCSRQVLALPKGAGENPSSHSRRISQLRKIGRTIRVRPLLKSHETRLLSAEVRFLSREATATTARSSRPSKGWHTACSGRTPASAEACDFGPFGRSTATFVMWVPAELNDLDAIVHLAALSNDPLGDVAPSLTEQINRDATLQLAKAARKAGVRRFGLRILLLDVRGFRQR